MESRARIERALLTELKRAQEIYEQRRREFGAVIAEVPSGIPQPDGQVRITNARADNSSALEGFTRALRDFNDFVLNGVVPEHLKNPTGI